VIPSRQKRHRNARGSALNFERWAAHVTSLLGFSSFFLRGFYRVLIELGRPRVTHSKISRRLTDELVPGPMRACHILAKMADRKNTGLEKLSALLSRQYEGLSNEERESRLRALERIANSVRARRSSFSPFPSTPANQG
jgi:hypothetical protein